MEAGGHAPGARKKQKNKEKTLVLERRGNTLYVCEAENVCTSPEASDPVEFRVSFPEWEGRSGVSGVLPKLEGLQRG